MIDVPGAAEGTTAAFGINNRGDVVGRYMDERRRPHGFLLRHGRFTTIDAPGSVLTVARGIDDLGRIVGFYAGKRRRLPRIHSRFAAVTGTSISRTPAGTAAFDINALKQIVGGYFDTSGVPHGYLLKKGSLHVDRSSGRRRHRAFGINILGQIVGGWTDDPECPDCFTKAFLLTHRGFENLEFPGALETVANGINAAGRSWASTSERTKSSTDSCAAATTDD